MIIKNRPPYKCNLTYKPLSAVFTSLSLSISALFTRPVWERLTLNLKLFYDRYNWMCYERLHFTEFYLKRIIFFFTPLWKKKIKWMKFGVMNFYTKEICTRRLVFSLRQNIRDLSIAELVTNCINWMNSFKYRTQDQFN